MKIYLFTLKKGLLTIDIKIKKYNVSPWSNKTFLTDQRIIKYMSSKPVFMLSRKLFVRRAPLFYN